MSEEKNTGSEQKDSAKRAWDELLFTAFEKIAATPGRLKDPKESLSTAFDWMKGMREEVQERIRDEIANRVGKLDFNKLSRGVGDHLAKNYKLRVNATIDWEPKIKGGDTETKISVDRDDIDISIENKDS